MTDLEITRLCAEAMELPNIQLTEIHVRVGWKSHWYVYNPLHDDAQAMALVKRFSLAVQPPQFVSPPRWHVWRDEKGSGKGKHTGVATVLDLNRAICLCVANMQQSKA